MRFKEADGPKVVSAEGAEAIGRVEALGSEFSQFAPQSARVP